MPDNVQSVLNVFSIPEAVSTLPNIKVNSIFIDPLSLGLEEASQFIFDVRELYPNIVFALYVDFNVSKTKDFYSGERYRFTHYYKLDKNTPETIFADEVGFLVQQCQNHLLYKLTAKTLDKLDDKLIHYKATTSPEDTISVSVDLLKDIQNQLNIIKQQQANESDVKNNSVFLSYRFAETEYIEGLQALLKREGFTIVTGLDTNTYISKGVLSRIKACHLFLCVMTRADQKTDGTYTTSPWLLEEKGAALAMDKNIVLMVEDGVTDFGGLQGDWQRIHFTAKSFTTAAIKAVDQLKTYIS